MAIAASKAAKIGAATGALSGVAITLIMNLGLSEALLRIGVLMFSGAWGGAIIGWLDHGLERAHHESRQQEQCMMRQQQEKSSDEADNV